MNVMKLKTTLFCLLLAIFTLSACGIKGDLYQTPASAKGEGIVTEEVTSEDVIPEKSAPEDKLPEKNALEKNQ